MMANPTPSERITRNSHVMLGKPVTRGIRMPVYLEVDLIEEGNTPAEFVDDYPELTFEDVEAAVAFAHQSPLLPLDDNG